jgi:hypothetical protein
VDCGCWSLAAITAIFIFPFIFIMTHALANNGNKMFLIYSFILWNNNLLNLNGSLNFECLNNEFEKDNFAKLILSLQYQIFGFLFPVSSTFPFPSPQHANKMVKNQFYKFII